MYISKFSILLKIFIQFSHITKAGPYGQRKRERKYFLCGLSEYYYVPPIPLAEFYFLLRSFIFIFIYILFLIILTTHVISFTYVGHYSYFRTNQDVCFLNYFSLFLHLIQQKLPGCGF